MTCLKGLTKLIGNTPVVKINFLSDKLNCEIFGKLEFFNPLSSVKDRTAFGIIKDAFKRKKIKKGSLIIEATSGNTGIALSWISSVMGLKFIAFMPENMSLERRKIMSALGAEIVLTPQSEGMGGAIKKAAAVSKNKRCFLCNQFSNPSNPKIHFQTTGPEIYEEFGKKLDYFICGVGTGGTISGAGVFLKSKIKKLKIVAVEPEYSPILSKGRKGPHKIQGIGAGFVPDILDRKIIDDIIRVKDEQAKKYALLAAKKDGIFAGISSGAVLKAADKICRRLKLKNKKILLILPDTMERYLTSYLFED